MQLQARIAALEAEIANLRARLTAKPELHSTTNVKETYKVKARGFYGNDFECFPRR